MSNRLSPLFEITRKESPCLQDAEMFLRERMPKINLNLKDETEVYYVRELVGRSRLRKRVKELEKECEQLR